jgi:hypothetical protein
MTTQLTLLHLPARSARPAGADEASGSDAQTPTRGSGRPIGASRRPATARTPRRAAGTRRSADHVGWLDQRTIETGRQGLAAARAALADATRRAHARDEERVARRNEELARQADVLRHPSGRGSQAA